MSFTNDIKPSASVYTNDTKPYLASSATWASILTTWETEVGTWANVNNGGAFYSNDLKP